MNLKTIMPTRYREKNVSDAFDGESNFSCYDVIMKYACFAIFDLLIYV